MKRIKSGGRIAIGAVCAAIKGDRLSMGMILEHYRKMVFRISIRCLAKFGMGSDYHAAEDITQETLMEIGHAIRHNLVKYWKHYKTING